MCLSICSIPKTQTVLSLDTLGTMCPGTCTGMFVRLAVSMSNGTFGQSYIILFSGIRYHCRTTVPLGPKWSNPVLLDTTLTFPMLFGFIQICLATRSLAYVLVVLTLAGMVSEAFFILTFMPVLVTSRGKY